MGGFGFQQTELRAVGHGGALTMAITGSSRTTMAQRAAAPSHNPVAEVKPAGKRRHPRRANSSPNLESGMTPSRTGSADRARPGKRWRAAGATDGPDAGWCAAGAEAGKRNARRRRKRPCRSVNRRRPAPRQAPSPSPPAAPTQPGAPPKLESGMTRPHLPDNHLRLNPSGPGAARASAGSGTRRPRSARPGGWRAGAG